MTKDQVVFFIAQKTCRSKAESERIYNEFFGAGGVIEQLIVKDEKFDLGKLGSFKKVAKPAKTIPSPFKKGETISVPAKNVLTFRPSANLKKAIQ